MPGQSLATELIVLRAHPPSDKFVRLDTFSAELGAAVVYQRLSRKAPQLSLFDRASADLQAAPQGHAWFASETRLLDSHASLGRSYEALTYASAFASCLLENPVPDESWGSVFALLERSLKSFVADGRPDITYFKSLCVLVRDEGFPLRQEWLPSLSAADRTAVEGILAQPVASQPIESEEVRRLLGKLTDYLEGHTELRVSPPDSF